MLSKWLMFCLAAGGTGLCMAEELPLDSFVLMPFIAMRKEDAIHVVIPENPDITNATRGASRTFKGDSLKPFLGKYIQITCEARYDHVTQIGEGPRNVSAGKILLSVANQAGTHQYFASNFCNGSSNGEWRPLGLQGRIPEDTVSMNLHLGIQWGTGTIDFRNIRMTECESPFKTVAELPENFRCEYTERVSRLPQLRGAMSPPPLRITEKDLRDFGQWGGNLLRWQLLADGIDVRNIDQWRDVMRRQLDRLESLLPVLQEEGIYVIIDIHSPVGGRYRNGGVLGTAGSQYTAMFAHSSKFLVLDEPTYHDEFLRMWREIVLRFRGKPMIYGYDIYNEPDQQTPSQWDYLGLQYEVAKLIRELDEETPIIICCNQWSCPKTFSYLQPLPLVNLIYQSHMYEPGDFTHQGVGNPVDYKKGYPATAVSYPNSKWDKHFLENALAPVRAFQLRYGARILIGEFSAIRWAPGAARYLEDAMDIMDEYGFDWCYHAYREWNGWSLEHSDDPHNDNPVPANARKAIVLKHFEKNRCP